MITSSSFLFCLYLSILSILFALVHSHGSCIEPRTRGTLRTNSILNEKPHHPLLRRHKFKKYYYLKDVPMDDCPHCHNGGGKGSVMKAAGGKWSPYEPLNPKLPFRTDHGVCGDAKMAPTPHDHEAGGKFGYPKSPIVASYKPGQIVEFMVDVTTNHNGWFEFFICDAVSCGGDISHSCFKKGHCYQLMREKTPVCETEQSKECAPVDEKYPGRWYLPCRKPISEHFMGGPFMRYKLPPGFKSNHAVIQFYWATANSCNPPGYLDYFKRYPMNSWGKCEGDGGAVGGRNPTLGPCGGGSFPEEFWGCADVSVGGMGAPTDAGPLPPPPPPPAPAAPKIAEPTPQPIPTIPSAPVNSPQPKPQNVPMVTPEPTPKSTPQPKMKKKSRKENKRLHNRKGNGWKRRAKCAKNWTQCDGRYYKGKKGACCNYNYVCHRINDYYSQCRKIRK